MATKCNVDARQDPGPENGHQWDNCHDLQMSRDEFTALIPAVSIF